MPGEKQEDESLFDNVVPAHRINFIKLIGPLGVFT